MPEISHPIVVAFDPTLHARSPESPSEEIVWAYLDTAYNLLREAAARLTIQEMREVAIEAGFPFPDDEQVFKDMAENTGVVATYMDLAPHSNKVAAAMDAAFRLLVAKARHEAADAAGGDQ